MTLWNNTTNRSRYCSAWVICALLVLFAFASSTNVFAQSGSTAAGTKIGNTASVSYVDASSQPHTNQSTPVYTYVQQIDAFTLTPTAYTVSGVANQNINIKYTLTNNSNGTDVVQLSIPAGYQAKVSNPHLYPDNGSGTAPNLSGGTLEGTNVTLTQSGAGSTSTFWLVMQIASNALTTDSGKTITVNAIDQPALIPTPPGAAGNWTTPTAYNTAGSLANGLGTVTVNIVTGAAMTVTKSFSATSGASGQTLTVTLTYANTGLITSGQTYITDVLTGANGNFTYVPGSAKWNGVAISDSNGTSTVGGVTATWNWTSGTKTLAASLNNVPPSNGSTYNFTYQVTVNGAPATYTNTAQYIYNDSVNWNPTTASPVITTGNAATYCSTNPTQCLTTSAQYTVNQTYAATLATMSTNPVASATAAQPILYGETATNTGNGSDTLVLSNNLGTFPAGTTFTYYTNAGTPAAPVAGTQLSVASGSAGQAGATYNTGVLAASGTYNYVIAVQVPAAVYGGPYSFSATATPQNGAGTAASVTDTLTAIVAPVDLTSAVTNGTFAASLGVGPGPEVSAQVTNPVAVNPQVSYTYELFVANKTTLSDTFKIVSSSTTTFSNSDNLPVGWTIGYFNSSNGTDCTALGAATSFPVTVAGGAHALVCAVVNTPAQTAPATYAVYFQAFSTGSSGSKDAIHDALLIATYHNVSIAPASGSVNAGAAVVLTNTITNSGNVAETITFTASPFVHDAPVAGVFTSTLYQNYSAGSVSGQITASTSFSIPAGATANIYTQVAADSGDAIGNQDVTTVTITYNSTNTSANDTTTVTGAGAAVSVTKQQALDASCNKSGLVFVTTPVQAKPGQCVVYQITATNGTGQAITNVVVSDALSTYTTYCDGTAGTCGASEPKGDWTTLPTGIATSPGPGVLTAGTLGSTALPTMNSGDSAVFTFAVKIN